jgi:(p)ppGpp synthase/HD superfamily hydrolase
MQTDLGFEPGSPLVAQAYRFARTVHGDSRSEGPRIDHPVEVARILRSHGFDDEVVAAGLLHDVVEHSDHSLGEVRRRFGRPVGELVDAMTENPSISGYRARKAEHRDRLARLDERAAAIFAADKLAKAREIARDGETPPASKLDHYAASLRMLRREHPQVPLLDDLEHALVALCAGVAG